LQLQSPVPEQSNSNLQKLLSSRYGTFDSENWCSDQDSCNLVVKGLFGDVSGNFQLDFNIATQEDLPNALALVTFAKALKGFTPFQLGTNFTGVD
jgi:hypothetical protein